MSNSNQNTIPEAIISLREEFGGNPRGINEGECMAFIDQLFLNYNLPSECKRMETGDLPSQYILEEEGFSPEPYHVWITDGNKHYDAECPNGVQSWKCLPFFKRTLGLCDS